MFHPEMMSQTAGAGDCRRGDRESVSGLRRIHFSLFARQLLDSHGPTRERRTDAQLVEPGRVEELYAVAPPLGVKDPTDVAAGLCFYQRDLEANQLIEITVQAPVEDPGRFDAEYSRSLITGTFKLGDAYLRTGGSGGEGEK